MFPWSCFYNAAVDFIVVIKLIVKYHIILNINSSTATDKFMLLDNRMGKITIQWM